MMGVELTLEIKLFVTAFLIVAATIDGTQLKVPNWLNLPMILAGLLFWAYAGGFAGFGIALLGTFAGIATLIVPYALKGMGGGDVKMMGALGTWVGPIVTLQAFVVSAIVGGVMGAAIILRQKGGYESLHRLVLSFYNLVWFRDLAWAVPGDYKASTKLPYGIPIAIGSIAVLFFV